MFESKTIEHDGFTIRIDVVQDSDYKPHDAECFTAEDIEAWNNDEWFFVGYVYTATKNGIELGEASIWGNPWDFPGGESSIDAWIAEDYYHADLIRKAVTEARASIAKLSE